MIEVERLSKRFGPVTAVDDLSFTVRPGRVTGFLGPNGAGKTTTMRVILGLDAADAGTATVGGRRYDGLIRPRRRVGGFSLGMKQRLGIAAALLGDPPVLMFDEPVNGLDPEGIHWIRGFFRELAADGRTVLVSSHLMSEMAQTADHLVIIGRGRLIADVPTEELIESSARRDVLVRSPRAAELAELIAQRGGAVTRQDDGALVVTGLDAAAIGDRAAGDGIAVHALVPRQASLEDAYLELTGELTEYRGGTR